MTKSKAFCCPCLFQTEDRELQESVTKPHYGRTRRVYHEWQQCVRRYRLLFSQSTAGATHFPVPGSHRELFLYFSVHFTCSPIKTNPTKPLYSFHLNIFFILHPNFLYCFFSPWCYGNPRSHLCFQSTLLPLFTRWCVVFDFFGGRGVGSFFFELRVSLYSLD